MELSEIKTAQQAFDYVVTRLADQRGPAMRQDTSSCVYLSDDGRKCAVGHVIRDEDYRPALEGDTVASLIDKLRDTASWRLIASNVNFWKSMQRAHDKAYSKDRVWTLPWTEPEVSVSRLQCDSGFQEHGVAWALQATGEGFGLDTSIVREKWPR